MHSMYPTSQKGEGLIVANETCLQARSNGQEEPGKSGDTLGQSNR